MPGSKTLLHAAKILVADDDVVTREICAVCLRDAGFRVVTASDGLKCRQALRREKPALLLLDLEMPHLSGMEIIRLMRAEGDRTPILVLTGFNDLDRRVKGLGAGADDYLGKPFNDRELVARVGALLRRSQAVAAMDRLVLGDTTIDLAARTATRGAGETIALTKKEFAIIELLARSEGRPVARDTLLDVVWGYSGNANTRTLDTHIWRLRRKLGDNAEEPRWIVGVAGVGYKLLRDQAAAGG